MINYLEIKSISILFQKYVFIDHKNYRCDAIFNKYKIFVLFGNEYEHDGFRAIFVRVWIGHKKEFEKAMDELNTKLLSVYGQTYISICNRFNALLNEEE